MYTVMGYIRLFLNHLITQQHKFLQNPLTCYKTNHLLIEQTTYLQNKPLI